VNLCLRNSPYSLNCHVGAMLVFRMLCRITQSSDAHRTESVSVSDGWRTDNESEFQSVGPETAKHLWPYLIVLGVNSVNIDGCVCVCGIIGLGRQYVRIYGKISTFYRHHLRTVKTTAEGTPRTWRSMTSDMRWLRKTLT